MNKKTFAATIVQLRKRAGMTQSALAKRLNVSDKTVSKWETGLGYPEITLLPKLAAVFGVTIDYLITGQRRGITVAGNILTDIVKEIDCYPQAGMLSQIRSISKSVGGCVPNTAITLTKLDPSIPVSIAGCVGDDDNGRYALSQMQRQNIDTGRVKVSDAAPTGFSDVMSLSSGERTHFHAPGINALFRPEDIDLPGLTCNLLHIGHLLLLDQFDAEDPQYGTAAARFLHSVQNAGIRTSIDIVSSTTADFPGKIIPVLKYSDYVIINEIECCSIWGLSPRDAVGVLNLPVIRDAMTRTMACGVSGKVIVHSKEAGFCLDADGHFTAVPALQIPSGQIKSSVGAGDAFCAACLLGIYNQCPDREILEFASGVAACSLFAENAVDGIPSPQEIRQILKNYPRKNLPDIES